jgi:type II secretory pathway pseudopilin PulG
MIGAFSLLELLVATAVFVGLALILVSIAGSLSSFWQMGIAHNERRAAALAAFSRMARDLRFASAPINPASTNFQLVINPSGVGSAYKLPQAAFWQAPVAPDRSQGDIALVGYFVQWVTNSPTDFVPKLCRLVIDSTNFQLRKPSDWVDNALIANFAPATKASDYDGQLAENVLGLWLQPLDQAKQPITRDASTNNYVVGEFDSMRGYPATLTNAATTNSLTYTFRPALPASIEAAMVVVDARTAKRLSGSEKPSARSSTNMWDDVNAFYNGLPPGIKQGAHIYSTVMELHNAPR